MIDSVVRVYEGEWFSEGRITEIEGDDVTVDFCDWVQRYKLTELRTAYIFYEEVLLAEPTAGTVIQDFR